jgi:hypothetical protein
LPSYTLGAVSPAETHAWLLPELQTVVVVIGQDWLEQMDWPRAENDFVRIEIAALRRERIRVIPVLVQGATMPKRAILPRPLQSLCRRNGVEVADAHFAAVDRRIAFAVGDALAGRGLPQSGADRTGATRRSAAPPDSGARDDDLRPSP